MGITPEHFEAAYLTMVTWHWDLPANFGATQPYFVIGVNMALSSEYSGAESTLLSYHYRVLPRNNIGGAFTQVLETLNSSDAIDRLADSVQRTRLVIPNATIVGNEGGLVECTFSVRAGSTGPDLFIGDVRGSLVFGPQGSVPSGFSEVA